MCSVTQQHRAGGGAECPLCLQRGSAASSPLQLGAWAPSQWALGAAVKQACRTFISQCNWAKWSRGVSAV